jgi:hypothetical protein
MTYDFIGSNPTGVLLTFSAHTIKSMLGKTSQGFYRPIRVLALQIGYKYEKIRSKFRGFCRTYVTPRGTFRSGRMLKKKISVSGLGANKASLLKGGDVLESFIVFDAECGAYIIERAGSAF